jgi:hypothetical protein
MIFSTMIRLFKTWVARLHVLRLHRQDIVCVSMHDKQLGQACIEGDASGGR